MRRKLSCCLATVLTLALLAGCSNSSVAQTGFPTPESPAADAAPVLAIQKPTPEPTPEPTQEPTPESTQKPTLEPTPEPTQKPTPEPTQKPTPEPTPEPTVEPTPEQTPEPTLEPTPEPTPEPTQEPTPGSTSLPWPVYEFGVPVKESDPVTDDSFFDNAVFLGDSRTGGLELFGGTKHGTFYWAQGMSVFRTDNEKYKIFSVDGEDFTMVGALGQRSYDAVYIMLGVNELGYSVESYEAGFSNLVDKVIAAQPEAVVYVQIMPPLNDAICQASGLASYINNVNLRKFNEAIQRVAAEKKVALLNTAEVYTGEDSQLPRELTNDGCHFVYRANGLWADYLRSHVIDRDCYFYSREQA